MLVYTVQVAIWKRDHSVPTVIFLIKTVIAIMVLVEAQKSQFRLEFDQKSKSEFGLSTLAYLKKFQ